MSKLVFATAVAFVISIAEAAHAATFDCTPGDLFCLIASIGVANDTPGPNTINLAPGTYVLESVNNTTVEGPNAFPVVTGNVRIVGGGASTTVIRRGPAGPFLRFFQVAPGGELVLEAVTIQQARLAAASFGGAAILNLGSTTLTNAIVRNNVHQNEDLGGAIRNLGVLTLVDTLVELNLNRAIVTGGFFSNNVFATGSRMTIVRSTIRMNRAETGAAITSLGGGPTDISESTISDNQADISPYGAAIIAGSGDTTIRNTTIARNAAAGVVAASGNLRFINATIVDNIPPGGTDGGGILNAGIVGNVQMQNTILARNTIMSGANAIPRDCAGSVGSLGNNLVGTYSGCALILLPSDKLGDPGLGFLTDERPSATGAAFGLGHVPLLAGSQAIDGGDPAVCSSADQLGFPRADGDLNGSAACDIGAIEYEPLVNSLVAMGKSETVRARRKLDGFPGGTATLTARYRNTSSTTIVRPVFVVNAIGNGALLLNGDARTPGGVGARLTPDVGGTRSWLPGQSITVRFVMGLQEARIPAFGVDLFGYPQ